MPHNILRTRFGRDIVAEFAVPVRTSRKVIILCDGLPSVPAKHELISWLAQRGYWVFHLRYRGTWESGGKFLAASPERDVLDVINRLPKGFRESWGNRRFRVDPKSITVVGASFGGTTALMAVRDPRVSAAIAFSPVVDWRVPSKAEPWDEFIPFVGNGFGSAYRVAPNGWRKLRSGKFFNPVNHCSEFDGRRLLILQAKDDDVVPWQTVERFSFTTDATLWLRNRGGHLSSRELMLPAMWKRMDRWLKGVL